MKKAILFLSAYVVLLSACGGADKKKKSAKGDWTQAERKEFMRNCISSAKQTYEQRGLQPDSAVINCMCQFSGKTIEEKYAYTDADKVSPDEVKGIMESAAKTCLTEK